MAVYFAFPAPVQSRRALRSRQRPSREARLAVRRATAFDSRTAQLLSPASSPASCRGESSPTRGYDEALRRPDGRWMRQGRPQAVCLFVLTIILVEWFHDLGY